MKSNKKLLIGIIITASCCVLAAVITVSILLSGKNLNEGEVDNSVSYGYVSSVGNTSPGATVPPSVLTPYFCAFRFETNVYEVNDVSGKFSYAISERVFEEVYENKLGYCSHRKDTITEYNIYLAIKNPAIVNNLISSKWYQGTEYAQLLKECGVGEAQNGVYIHERLEFNDFDSFPFDEYSISIYRDEKQIISEFAHTDEITIPEQLLVGDEGRIYINLVECVTYGSGNVEYLTNEEPSYFYYQRNGSQVKLSKNGFN